MQNRPSQGPRDMIRRTAMNDAAIIASMMVEFQAAYEGPDRDAYHEALGSWLGDLDGSVVQGPAVQFPTRRIAIRFGPVFGHR